MLLKIYEDSYSDYWLDKATRGYGEPEWLNAAISATATDTETGDLYDIYFVYTDKSGEYTMSEFEKIVRRDAVDIVYDHLDGDERFDDYETLENVEVVIDDIDFYIGKYEE
jgi:hypothetical protein